MSRVKVNIESLDLNMWLTSSSHRTSSRTARARHQVASPLCIVLIATRCHLHRAGYFWPLLSLFKLLVQLTPMPAKTDPTTSPKSFVTFRQSPHRVSTHKKTAPALAVHSVATPSTHLAEVPAQETPKKPRTNGREPARAAADCHSTRS